MWVIGENGNAYNLARAHGLHCQATDWTKFDVVAVMGFNEDEVVELKSFDSAAEACAYIKGLVADLNADRISEVAGTVEEVKDAIYDIDDARNSD